MYDHGCRCGGIQPQYCVWEKLSTQPSERATRPGWGNTCVQAFRRGRHKGIKVPPSSASEEANLRQKSFGSRDTELPASSDPKEQVGSLERSHHSPGRNTWKQFADQEEDWDEWLELATFSANTSVHEGNHRYQPFQSFQKWETYVPITATSAAETADPDQLFLSEKMMIINK
ncbi:hypothetical protein KQX54_000395 [Cotesia glomerata]|uniref:Uncharacterized protein n=1 Tax=Cotesia glomerata TaxID=32391 RepID=A0AAV7IZ23_COTGL|nr:hypothetical protein KQX54_000395 [Cotesia glomerata]